MEPAGAYPAPVHSVRRPRWVAPPAAGRLTTRRASDDSERPERRPGIPALDGLRAVAVALVLADHGGIPGMAGGFLGVDMFFVLSGFLITSLLLDELGRSRSYRPGQLLDSAGPPVAAGAGVDGADGGGRASVLLTRSRSRDCATTPSPRSSGWRTGCSSPTRPAISPRARRRRRCSTPGRSGWRSSTTSSGRWC